MRKPKDLKEVIQHHFKGGKFLYDSYDHVKAQEYYMATDEYKHLCVNDEHFAAVKKLDKLLIPEKIRDMFAIKKNGKLRTIDIAPDGDIRGVKIGNKRPVNFYRYSLDKLYLTFTDCPKCNAGAFNGTHCFDCGSDF